MNKSKKQKTNLGRGFGEGFEKPSIIRGQISVALPDDIHSYQGIHPDLIKLWNNNPEPQETLFPVSIKIEDTLYEAIYGMQIKTKGDTTILLNRIYMGISINKLGNNRENQIKTARKIKRKVVARFIKTIAGKSLFLEKVNLDSIKIPSIAVIPNLIVF